MNNSCKSNQLSPPAGDNRLIFPSLFWPHQLSAHSTHLTLFLWNIFLWLRWWHVCRRLVVGAGSDDYDDTCSAHSTVDTGLTSQTLRLQWIKLGARSERLLETKMKLLIIGAAGERRIGLWHQRRSLKLWWKFPVNISLKILKCRRIKSLRSRLLWWETLAVARLNS